MATDHGRLPMNGTRGRTPSRSLFLDGTYNIEDFHDKFIELEDMTEYKPAIQLCGSWAEWNRLKRDWPAFATYIAEWKEELEIKLRSESVEKIIQFSRGDDPKALQASRFISEAGWGKRSGAGRPSKAERAKETKEIARAAAETAAEEKRIAEILEAGGGLH